MGFPHRLPGTLGGGRGKGQIPNGHEDLRAVRGENAGGRTPGPRRLPRLGALGALGALGILGLGSGPAEAKTPAGEPSDLASRLVGATAEATARAALAEAGKGGEEALGALVLAASLSDTAPAGLVRRELARIGQGKGEIAAEARWLALSLAPEPPEPAPAFGEEAARAAPDPDGLVRALALLGPFPDTGGGLDRAEGPEEEDGFDPDPARRFDYGVYDLRWRRALAASASPRGLPLDLYVQPRAESCTYLATRVKVPGSLPRFQVRVAAAGSLRLIWNGRTVLKRDAVHPRSVLDRAAAEIEASPGDHLLALKVCSGSVPDEGRVRIRLTDPSGKPLALETSSDLRGAPSAPRGGSAKEIPTPLEASLELGEAPGEAELLEAAILRTLGGADDAQSPRAPGLLDRIASGKEAPAATFALAGYLSSFGANRSGWLGEALFRARREGNEAALSFAQRAQVEGMVSGSSELPEWALARASEAPLAGARDAEARLLRVEAKLGVAKSALSRAASGELLAVASEEAGRTPAAVWRAIADLPGVDPKTSLFAHRMLAEVTPEARNANWVSAHGALGAASLEKAAASALARQTRASDVIAIGETLLGLGRYAWAAQAFRLATFVAPNLEAAHRGLAASLLAEAGKGRGEAEDARRKALAALERARELAPTRAATKAELALRRGDGAKRGGATSLTARKPRRDEAFLTKPEVFLARAKRSPAEVGEVFDRQLHWTRVVTYHPDRRVSQLMHYAREIVVAPRTEEDLYEAVPTEGGETELLFARVHKKDGRVLSPAEANAAGERPEVRWPRLEPGDVVEVAVRAWTPGPVGRRGDPPFYFVDYVGSVETRPILFNEVLIDEDPKAPLAVDVLNGKASRVSVSEKNGRRVTRYVWDRPALLKDEPFAPKLSELVPVVVGSSFSSWKEFLGWYRGAVSGFEEPDLQVRRLAEELTRGKARREEKIRALFNFVADDIRYVNYVSGEWWLPNRPQQLLARRQGDCDDKAILLISLLRAVGIRATEVLVQTRLLGEPSVLRSDKAAVPLFDHGIAYLPGEGNKPGLWLDATSPESRLGPLPSMDARASALFVHEGEPAILDTPRGSPDDHGTKSRYVIKVLPSGAAEISAEETHAGDAAFLLRTQLGQADARAPWVEQNVASSLFPAVAVKGKVRFSPEGKNGVAELGYEARSEGLARREGFELAVPLAESQTLTSQLAPLTAKERSLPVVLPPWLAPSHQTREYRILPPAGFELAELPPGGEVDGGAFGRASLEISRDSSGAARVVRRLVIDQDRVPLAEYPKWREFLQGVDRLMNRAVRFVPTKGR